MECVVIGRRPLPEDGGWGCETWKHATSYCETECVLLEFWGCVPAYTVPALPEVLKAEPDAEAEWPGVIGSAWQL